MAAVTHCLIGLGVSTEEFRFSITIILIIMVESTKSEVSHAVANLMCLNVYILAYTLWVLQWSMNHFAYLAMQVHAQCTRDNMTAYVFTTAITTSVCTGKSNNNNMSCCKVLHQSRCNS